MFNNNDNFGLVFGLLAMVASFFMGKDYGEKKTIQRFEEAITIKEQQEQIALLHAKIDEMRAFQGVK